MVTDFKHPEGSGTVFVNDYKKEDKHPDLKGRVTVDGKIKSIAMWERKAGGYSIRIEDDNYNK